MLTVCGRMLTYADVCGRMRPKLTSPFLRQTTMSKHQRQEEEEEEVEEQEQEQEQEQERARPMPPAARG